MFIWAVPQPSTAKYVPSHYDVAPSKINEEVAPMPLKRSKPTLAQCKASTSSGERCKAKPHKEGLCFFHSDPKRAAELGREGGRRNRHLSQTPVQRVTPPESAGDVKQMLAESMAEVRNGRMNPKLGTTLAYMGVSLLKAIEITDIDDRLKKLELTHELEDPTQAAPPSR